jgi:hypothetical protein
MFCQLADKNWACLGVPKKKLSRNIFSKKTFS